VTHESAIAAAVGTAAAVAVLARLAPQVGLVDVPGGRKDHHAPVPVVGGIALALCLFLLVVLRDRAPVPPMFLVAAGVLVAVSAWDDIAELHHLPRFAGQVVAALLMVVGAGVELRGLGDLFGWRPIGMWVLGVPATVFATVGVINAVNMIDGMDGLAGSVALVTLAWLGVAAGLSGLGPQAGMAWVLCAGLAGFLVFNVRHPWQPRARVFLGDAGSTMLGLAIAWLAIDVTQGPGRSMPPVAALWVALLPLADTVSLMLRRVSRGASPFRPDREHIHHYLLAKGFSVSGALLVLVLAAAACGAVGVVGWRMGLPEPLLFYGCAAAFLAYHFAMRDAWARLYAQGFEGTNSTVGPAA
jgi:UDP-GlcNAc:undecaprenyl-phosphate GlcNAc-1-phosphate transferase